MLYLASILLLLANTSKASRGAVVFTKTKENVKTWNMYMWTETCNIVDFPKCWHLFRVSVRNVTPPIEDARRIGILPLPDSCIPGGLHCRGSWVCMVRVQGFQGLRAVSEKREWKLLQRKVPACLACHIFWAMPEVRSRSSAKTETAALSAWKLPEQRSTCQKQFRNIILFW